MKGIVFTEFLNYVSARFGHDMVDDIIEDCDFDHHGAYTAVATYDHRELVRLIGALVRRSDETSASVLKKFGIHLSETFAARFPVFFENKPTLFDFLDSVEGTIHVEVLKLYPDAELPRFETTRPDDHHMRIDYLSSRCFSSLAEGLILGAAGYYRTPVELTRRPVSGGDQSHVRFSIHIRP